MTPAKHGTLVKEMNSGKSNTQAPHMTKSQLDNYSPPTTNLLNKIPSRSFTKLDKIQKNSQRLPEMDKSKVMAKNFGAVKGFSVNTHTGLVRNYNEDRVSILLNAQQR